MLREMKLIKFVGCEAEENETNTCFGCCREGNPHVFLGFGDEERNPFFGRREGGTSSNPHP